MEEAKQAMEEAHSGVYRAHQSGLGFMIVLKGWILLAYDGARLHRLCKEV